MTDHGHIHHDNYGMGLVSVILSIGSAVATKEVTGEEIHYYNIIIGAVIVFIVQKVMHYFWDKYVTKK